MCYHISQREIDRTRISDNFDHREMRFDVVPQYFHLNGFERGQVMIIPEQRQDQIELATWSILPQDHENPKEYWKKQGGGALNTVAENLFSTKLAEYKSAAMLNRKCVILVTGFFEPHKFDGSSYPYYIESTHFDMFGLCGYYTYHGDQSMTCSVLTIEANEEMAKIHNTKNKHGQHRMPMTVLPEDINYYLNLDTEEKLIEEFITHRAIDFSARTVDRDVLNSHKKSNRADILHEVYYPELDSLFG